MERIQRGALLQMPLLEVKNVKVWYPVRGGMFKPKKFVKAVNDISFQIEKGETLGLVGESGCGKSSLGRAVVRLEDINDGKVILDGRDITNLKGRQLRESRKDFQMIFQDPYGSLNPKMTIYSALDEVIRIHSSALGKEQRLEKIYELMEMVGLNREHINRYPHQFSGGQRQRIGIARALAVNPKLIVADEPVSALDVSVQAQIINLLIKIQKQTGISYLFIAHDLAVVEHISSKIIVMYAGRVMETGSSSEIVKTPKHPYTKALLSAVPTLDPETRKLRILLPGDVPSPVNPPSGCVFHPRCPVAEGKCKNEVPALKNISGSKRSCACHLACSGQED